MADPKTKTIEHRGRTYQVHVAARPGAGDTDAEPRHVHIQDLEGGAGRVLHFDSDEAREFARAHRDELAELGYDSEADRAEADAAARRDREQRDADDAERARIRRLMGTGDQAGDQQAIDHGDPPPRDY